MNIKKLSLKLIPIFLLSIIPFSNTYSQSFDDLKFGDVFDPIAFEKAPKVNFPKGRKNGFAPKRSLKRFCPTAGNQGSFGSCVAYAYAYGGLTILNAIQKGYTEKICINKERFSPSFLFNQIKLDSTKCTNAISLTAADFLKNTGVCLLKEYNSAANCDRPSANIIEKVEKYQVKDWRVLVNPKDDDITKIRKLKESINAGLPAIATIQVWESFYQLKRPYWELRKDNFVDKYYKGGFHTLVVVGYDENNFEVMNSWGENWGKDGFAVIPCKDFVEICLGAVQVVPKDNFGMFINTESSCTNNSETLQSFKNIEYKEKNDPKAIIFSSSAIKTEPYFYLEGNFSLLKKEVNTGLTFKESVRWNPDLKMYEQHINSLYQGTLVQLSTKDIPTGKYVYIFSCDPRGKVELHYESETYHFLKGEEIIIPSVEEALQLTNTGDEFFCILYAEDPIDDLELRLKSIKDYSSSNLWAIIQNTFKDLVIPFNEIDYKPDRMLANALSNSKIGTVLPILFHVETKLP